MKMSENNNKSTTKLFDRFNRDDYDTVIELGFDEAGRGCFFGPIMAGAVLWPLQETWGQELSVLAGKIKDSKKLSPSRRSEYAKCIRNLIEIWGVGIVHADEINEYGIQWANREAFRRALTGAWQKINPSVKNSTHNFRMVVDGAISFKDLVGSVLGSEKNCTEELIVEGDSKYLSIAAASILAKVEHDDWIEGWIEKNPENAVRYDMPGSKGYGTAKHRDGLGKWGALIGHRTLFVRNWVPGRNETVVIKNSKPSASYSSKKRDYDNVCFIKL